MFAGHGRPPDDTNNEQDKRKVFLQEDAWDELNPRMLPFPRKGTAKAPLEGSTEGLAWASVAEARGSGAGAAAEGPESRPALHPVALRVSWESA